MSANRLLFCALISLLACSCSTPGSRESANVSPATYLPAAIAHIEQTNPGSPALLNARLAYGEFLLSGASGPCAQRLVLAQEQLGSVESSLEGRALFPDGWAHAADLEYRLHLARADCGGQADRRDDLLAAADAARRAVKLYRNTFDYRSMVVMQFDAAATLRRLGDSAGAIVALQAALGMDREYGFADDARQNYKLLLAWRGRPAGARQVAQLMRDFPKRQAILKFGWHAGDARVTLQNSRDCLDDGQIIHDRAVAAYERHVNADPGGGWDITYARRLTRYEPGVWPSGKTSAQTAELYFPPVRLPALDFKVSATGEFEGVTNSKTFSARLIARTNGLIKAGAPPDGVGHDTVTRAVAAAAIALSPGMLEATTSESYQLETAMWVGAKLEQGVWYQMSAPLILPGLSQVVLQQQIEFAFTRMVPCTADAAAQSCVEIVIHATPDKDALQDLGADLAGMIEGATFFDYDASIDGRIVVDPATLRSYEHEERVYWYASAGKTLDDQLLESDHLVSTTTYGAH